MEPIMTKNGVVEPGMDAAAVGKVKQKIRVDFRRIDDLWQLPCVSSISKTCMDENERGVWKFVERCNVLMSSRGLCPGQLSRLAFQGDWLVETDRGWRIERGGMEPVITTNRMIVTTMDATAVGKVKQKMLVDFRNVDDLWQFPCVESIEKKSMGDDGNFVERYNVMIRDGGRHPGQFSRYAFQGDWLVETDRGLRIERGKGNEGDGQYDRR